MNFVFFAFLALSLVLVLLSIRDLVLARRLPVLPDNFGELPPGQAARVAIDLVDRGFFLRHILHNRGLPRDSKKHIAEYTLFLNEAAISAIKDLKGFEGR